jgi:hypothetical protein
MDVRSMAISTMDAMYITLRSEYMYPPIMHAGSSSSGLSQEEFMRAMGLALRGSLNAQLW